jgi:hypothetical protein
VHAVAFPGGYNNALAHASVDLNNNDVLDSDAEVLAAISEGYATDNGIVKRFVCPVIKLPRDRPNTLSATQAHVQLASTSGTGIRWDK